MRWNCFSVWDNGSSIGVQVADQPVDIFMVDGVFEGPCVKGKGSWNNPEWAGGEVAMTVDLKNMIVKFVDKAAGVEINTLESGLTYANGMINLDKPAHVAVYNLSGKCVVQGSTQHLDINNLGSGLYIVNATVYKPLKIIK